MRILVSGTIAYDIILDYPGRFADHIRPEKVHVLSLSFLIPKVQKSFGGTAANIAYNLAQLGVRTEMVGAVGEQDQGLIRHYQGRGIGTSYIKISRRYGTASAFIITDRDDNQISGFYPGAVNESARLPKLESCDWPIVAAENPKNMVRLARHYQKTKHRYIFDPGQAITALTRQQIRTCLGGASIVIGNDYEISALSLRGSRASRGRRSNLNDTMGLLPPHRVRGRNDGFIIVRTLGSKGSEILFPNGKKVKIAIAKPKKMLDPTGAGDAYRAGLIKGIVSGLDLKRSTQFGATAAAFALEKHGTQNHKFNYDILVKRHNKNFEEKI